jgi:4a-hydroxytetrahydrobiopterin dehydratase
MSTPLADRPLHQAAPGTPALAGDALAALVAELGPSWTVEGNRLRRTWKLPAFASALALGVKLGMLAEKLDHHPDLTISWGKLAVELWTHTVNGLSEADFIWAARAEQIAG